MNNIVNVKVFSRDLPCRVDAAGLGVDRARSVERGDGSLVSTQEVSVLVRRAAGVTWAKAGGFVIIGLTPM